MRAIALPLFLLLASCRSEPGLTPSPAEEARLDAHVESIFAGVAVEDAAQLDADHARIRAIHRIAYLAMCFHERAGRYPLADAQAPAFRQTLIGSDAGKTDALGETYVTQETFLAELRSVLGPEVVLPVDPLPQTEHGPRTFVYGVYGKGFTAAAMLYHPAGWSEGILLRQWQYRVGSYENLDLPVMSVATLLAGGYATPRPARWRDPSMAGLGGN